MGFAVLIEGELVDWGMKSFKGKWSKDKKKIILRSFLYFINYYHVTRVVIKVNRPYLSSKNLIELNEELLQTAKSSKLRVYLLTIDKLKRRFRARNKVDLARNISNRFPECRLKVTDYVTNNFRLIEAIAIGIASY